MINTSINTMRTENHVMCSFSPLPQGNTSNRFLGCTDRVQIVPWSLLSLSLATIAAKSCNLLITFIIAVPGQDMSSHVTAPKSCTLSSTWSRTKSSTKSSTSSSSGPGPNLGAYQPQVAVTPRGGTDPDAPSIRAKDGGIGNGTTVRFGEHQFGGDRRSL